MKYDIYSYRDKVTGFGLLMLDVNEQSAVRGFTFAVNGKYDLMTFKPSDFDLYRVGTFDNNTGVISAESIPVMICNGESVVSNEIRG